MREHDYDPENPPEPDEWLALDEGERIALIVDFHEDLASPHPEVPDWQGHAIFHAIVENQVALGFQPVREALARLQSEGLDRHEAVHAVGAVLARQMHELLGDEDERRNAMDAYQRELDELTAETWRTAADE